MREDASSHYGDYRRNVEEKILAPALRNAVLIFFLLQTLVFIPADWILHPQHFETFLGARLLINAALCWVYFGTALRWPVASSYAVCALGSLLFLSMILQTGGVASGYYVGMILLVIGMGVLTPLDARQSGAIAAMMFASYATLPFYSADPVSWLSFSEKLFFLGAACVEAWWACLHMDRMRFADYKQKRQLEQARDNLAQLDRAKSRFSANVHHELRTPLTLILAPLEALRSGEFGELPRSVQDTFATMQANGRRLHKMINNLLDLSKIEDNQFKISRRPMHLESLVADLVTSAAGVCERKQITLEMKGFEDLPTVNVDPEAIDKVLVNLLGNALKFTEAGDRIVLSGREHVEGIEISVEDSGLGISSDKLETIFDRFAQIDDSATRRHEGTGIGLSLAREMVDLHGGRIWAESQGEGCGTTLRLTLPIGSPDRVPGEEVIRDDRGEVYELGHSMHGLESDRTSGNIRSDISEMERTAGRWSDRQASPAGQRGCQHPDSNAPEILIAEDNPDMRALLEFLIGREFRVRSSRNGREALEALRESPPDLVLSDVMMPEMSGIELCSAIKGDPTSQAIPVVLITSKAEREMKIEGLELGADDYVTKPFHPRELLARVRSLVRVRNLQKQLAARNSELETALTDLQQAEVQLVQTERLAAVGELAAGLAHEVNNPVNFALNAIRAMAKTVEDLRHFADELMALETSDPEGLARRVAALKDNRQGQNPGDLSETLLELSKIVVEGLQRTSSLVGDLHAFARPGRAGEMRADVDLEAGLRSTSTLVSHALSAAGAKLEIDVEEGLPRVFGDPGGLNQVFLNLIKNSVEAFQGRGGTIRVEMSNAGDEIAIRIEDDGPGIPEREMPDLFEPFYTTKESEGGTGLGLSISQRIVLNHGGSIEVVRPEDRGACFIIRLPVSGSDVAAA